MALLARSPIVPPLLSRPGLGYECDARRRGTGAVSGRMVGLFRNTFIPIRTFVLAALGLILFLDAADAYTFSGVPCPWLGSSWPPR